MVFDRNDLLISFKFNNIFIFYLRLKFNKHRNFLSIQTFIITNQNSGIIINQTLSIIKSVINKGKMSTPGNNVGQ